jgi:undecaprenyl-diphosphatase
MSLFESLLLGILQALTEFFPVSSSAHLKVLKHFLGLQEVEHYVLFDLCCHMGTLFALLFFLRKDLLCLIQKERKKLALFFLALLPLIPCYFLLKPLRDLASEKCFLGFCWMGTGLILLAGQSLRMSRSKKDGKKMQDALTIGAMQSIALIPGISRSAATISCARILGWKAEEAVRFSFLLSIPTILGGSFLESLKSFSSLEAQTVPILPLLIAFASSLLLGLLVVGKAIRFLETGRLKPFAWYCLIVGIIASLYFNIG